MTDELQAAAALTTAQLEQAIEIVEGELGVDASNQRESLIGAVLITLAENYRRLPALPPSTCTDRVDTMSSISR